MVAFHGSTAIEETLLLGRVDDRNRDGVSADSDGRFFAAASEFVAEPDGASDPVSEGDEECVKDGALLGTIEGRSDGDWEEDSDGESEA